MLERLQEFLAKKPGDSFVRYGLAMELGRLGRTDEAAECFRELLAADPDYVPAYLQAGMLLGRAGRTAEARAVLAAGLEAAARKGDGHALGEMQGVLAELG
jgi:tetratricopeptide (TPR) repeat protein